MKDENCIFCKLAAGYIPTNTVYEDEYLRAIMDAAPANKGHIIILPKSHAANIFELEDTYVEKAFILAKKIAIALKRFLNCDGVNILQNNGEAAGQTVFQKHQCSFIKNLKLPELYYKPNFSVTICTLLSKIYYLK